MSIQNLKKFPIKSNFKRLDESKKCSLHMSEESQPIGTVFGVHAEGT